MTVNIFKKLILWVVAPLTVLLIRQRRSPWLRQTAWTTIAKPHLSWREYAKWSTPCFGARLYGRANDSIQGRILFFGVWEPALTAFLTRRLTPGDIFVDVGANIGYYSLLGAGLVKPNGRVIAIEASPSIFRDLRGNIGINKCDNISAIHAAVMGAAGTVSIYRGPHGNIGSTSTRASREFAFEAEVRADSLTALIGDDLFRAKAVKIDVEGAEGPILNSILNVAGKLNPNLEIIVEVTPAEVAEFGMTIAEIFERFRDAGFYPYGLDSSYDDREYLDTRPPLRPSRLRKLPTELSDVVFSRVEAEEL